MLKMFFLNDNKKTKMLIFSPDGNENPFYFFFKNKKITSLNFHFKRSSVNFVCNEQRDQCLLKCLIFLLLKTQFQKYNSKMIKSKVIHRKKYKI
ncbi:hypothetical protein EM308_07700 [Flavobacterium gilvum]|uniref:Uncharacterized protein n=1 Tax=Flavobacterium gilvum TaxID=1492737 RepID=A0AAC9I4G4_9FLAO|nr:hypothetical protein EM308_07700 [Flavobacterium gilvum]